jgi:hypothetical protein
VGNTRFLYGKKTNFTSFLDTGSPLWFRDIYSLGELENQSISDDESTKTHEVNSDQIQKVTIDGRDFRVAKDTVFKMNLPTRRCHVLCLSNSGNDRIMFERFDADVCLELNTDKIIEMMQEANRNRRLEIVGRNVEYYKKGPLPLSHDPFELVFKKGYERYHSEDEYRIAIFWPEDENSTILTTDNEQINVFGTVATNSDHIEIGFNQSDLKDILVNIIEFCGDSGT